MPINLPQVRKIGSLELLAKQAVEGFITGLHKSPYHGFSVEFAEHKSYNPGESTRHIDWKVYARTDRLYLKRYEEETNLRCQVLIDVSSSMYYPAGEANKINFSIQAAASLAYLLQKQRDAVGITSFSDAIEQSTDTKSTSTHIHKLFLFLEELLQRPKTSKPTNVASTIHLMADKLPKRSLVIIFSDMLDNSESLDEVFSALQHLKHKKHEVLLFHTVDKKTELDFEFENRPYIFEDLETGEKIKVAPSQVKEKYREFQLKFRKELKLRCGQLKVDLIEADINKGMDGILLPYLSKRARMR